MALTIGKRKRKKTAGLNKQVKERKQQVQSNMYTIEHLSNPVTFDCSKYGDPGHR